MIKREVLEATCKVRTNYERKSLNWVDNWIHKGVGGRVTMEIMSKFTKMNFSLGEMFSHILLGDIPCYVGSSI